MKKYIKGLVSLIMPTFNRGHMLSDRINEIFSQTYYNLELIIINDCSTDATETIVSDYDERPNGHLETRIKLINLHKNSGNVSIPRAIGIHQARGEYLAHIDDDCVNLPNKLEILVNLLDNNSDAVLAYGNRINVHLQSNREEAPRFDPNWNPTLPNNWGVDNSQIAYRANVYEKIPYVICNRGCDFELAKKLYPLGRFVSTPEVVSKYIWHGKNRSLDDSTKSREINMEEFTRYFQ